MVSFSFLLEKKKLKRGRERERAKAEAGSMLGIKFHLLLLMVCSESCLVSRPPPPHRLRINQGFLPSVNAVSFFHNLVLTSRPDFSRCKDRRCGALCPANLATLAVVQPPRGEVGILPTWFKNTTVFLTSGRSVGQTTDNSRFVCVCG